MSYLAIRKSSRSGLDIYPLRCSNIHGIASIKHTSREIVTNKTIYVLSYIVYTYNLRKTPIYSLLNAFLRFLFNCPNVVS